MLTERVRFKPLQDKITDSATAPSHIQDGTNLFISLLRLWKRVICGLGIK